MPVFDPILTIKPVYQKVLSYLLARDRVVDDGTSLQAGQLVNKMSQRGYDPLPVDTSYIPVPVRGGGGSSSIAGSSSTATANRFPDNDNVSGTRYEINRRRAGAGGGGGTGNGNNDEEDDDEDDEEDGGKGDSTTAGRDSLGPSYTTTAIVGQMSLLALERNARAYQASQTPFLLSVHFNAPVRQRDTRIECRESRPPFPGAHLLCSLVPPTHFVCSAAPAHDRDRPVL
jgi:hypothetical protein